MPDITTISIGGVNCYLLTAGDGFVLIDTGYTNHRADVEQALDAAGCAAGALRLIVLTHGDTDHTGSAAYLRMTRGAAIAGHRAEAAVFAEGDMGLARKNSPWIARLLFPLFRLKPADRFTPDRWLADGDVLPDAGLDLRVVHIPGHSDGSIGLMLPTGEFFCGDLLTNRKRPELNSLMDDKSAAAASIRKLQALPITTFYPGHGGSFEKAQLPEPGKAAKA
jgi:glyoxylase-like metal-dependent hydrolase (beta-lactamase superfamily II)